MNLLRILRKRRRPLTARILAMLGVVWLMIYFLLSSWLFDNDASARLIERAQVGQGLGVARGG